MFGTPTSTPASASSSTFSTPSTKSPNPDGKLQAAYLSVESGSPGIYSTPADSASSSSSSSPSSLEIPEPIIENTPIHVFIQRQRQKLLAQNTNAGIHTSNELIIDLPLAKKGITDEMLSSMNEAWAQVKIQAKNPKSPPFAASTHVSSPQTTTIPKEYLNFAKNIQAEKAAGKNIGILDLSNNKITKAGPLSLFIENCQPQYVFLAGNKLNKAGVDGVLSRHAKYPNIQGWDLSNTITTKDQLPDLKFLAEYEDLEAVSLAKNNLDCWAINKFGTSANNKMSKLAFLDLHGNPITALGKSGISQFTHLEYLNLEGCKLGLDNKNINAFLSDLGIQENTASAASSSSSPIVTRDLQKLEVLILSNNRFGRQVPAVLSACFMHPALKVLMMNNTFQDADGISRPSTESVKSAFGVLQGKAPTSKLGTLALSGNNINDDMAIALATVIAEREFAALNLDLTHNEFGNEGAQALLDSAKGRQGTFTFSTGNNIQDKTLLAEIQAREPLLPETSPEEMTAHSEGPLTEEFAPFNPNQQNLFPELGIPALGTDEPQEDPAAEIERLKKKHIELNEKYQEIEDFEQKQKRGRDLDTAASTAGDLNKPASYPSANPALPSAGGGYELKHVFGGFATGAALAALASKALKPHNVSSTSNLVLQFSEEKERLEREKADNLARFNREKTEADKKIAEQLAKTEKTQKDLKAAEDQLKKAHSDFDAAQTTFDVTHQKNVDALKKAEQRQRDLEATNEELAKEFKSLQTTAQKAQADSEQLALEKAAVDKKLAEKTALVETSQQALNSTKDALEQASKDVEVAKAAFDATNQKSVEALKQAELRQHDLEAANADLASQFKSLQTTAQKFQNESERLAIEKAAVDKKLTEQAALVEKSQQALNPPKGELETAILEVNAAKKELNSTQTALEESKAKLADMELAKTKLKTQLSDQQVEAQKVQKKKEQLEREKIEQDKKLVDAAQKLTAQQEKTEENLQALKRAQALVKQMPGLEESLKKSSSETEDAKRALESIQEDLETLKDRQRKLAADNTELARKFSTEQKAAQQAQADSELLAKEKADVDKKLTEQKDLVETTQKALDAAQAELKAAKGTVTIAFDPKALEEAKQRQRDLEATNAALKEQLNDQKMAVQQAQAKSESLAQEKAEADTKLLAQKAVVETTQRDLNTTQDELEKASSKVKSAQATLDSTQKALEKAEVRLGELGSANTELDNKFKKAAQQAQEALNQKAKLEQALQIANKSLEEQIAAKALAAEQALQAKAAAEHQLKTAADHVKELNDERQKLQQELSTQREAALKTKNEKEDLEKDLKLQEEKLRTEISDLNDSLEKERTDVNKLTQEVKEQSELAKNLKTEIDVLNKQVTANKSVLETAQKETATAKTHVEELKEQLLKEQAEFNKYEEKLITAADERIKEAQEKIQTELKAKREVELKLEAALNSSKRIQQAKNEGATAAAANTSTSLPFSSNMPTKPAPKQLVARVIPANRGIMTEAQRAALRARL